MFDSLQHPISTLYGLTYEDFRAMGLVIPEDLQAYTSVRAAYDAIATAWNDNWQVRGAVVTPEAYVSAATLHTADYNQLWHLNKSMQRINLSVKISYADHTDVIGHIPIIRLEKDGYTGTEDFHKSPQLLGKLEGS